MRIAVFGATGGIGRHVVERALAAGHEVVAMARDPAGAEPRERLTFMAGDLADPSAMARVVSGSDAVIWAVGPTSNTADQPPIFEQGARNLVGAMQSAGVKRLVALSGAGITVAGERKPLAGRLMTGLVAVLAKHVVEAKRREYEVFSASELEWTLARPPRVVEGPALGTYEAGDRLAGRTITQADLAQFMVDQLADRSWLREAPFVSRRPSAGPGPRAT
ncbi:NAD(P)H-binding protein [soil metagenome]